MKNIVKMLAIIALVAVIIACDTSGGDGDGDGHWLISWQGTHAVTDGIVGEFYTSFTSYDWIAYRYTNETNYEEEYTTVSGSNYSSNRSYSEHHYTRNGQASHSTTETLSKTFYDDSLISTLSSGTSEIASSYDLASSLTSSSTTVSSGVSTATVYYSIELLIDSGGVKTYKYHPVGSTWYNILKIQNGRTLETSYYDENNVLIYTTTYTQPDIAEIRSKLPNFTLYSTYYYSSSYSINSSYQTAEVLPKDHDNDQYLRIRVKTFNDGVLNSQTDYSYMSQTDLTNMKSNYEWAYSDDDYFKTERWGDYIYYENNGKIIIYRYTRIGGNANIPAEIKGKPVTGIAPWAFEYCYKLTSVTIPDGVTSIESDAFRYCESLTSVMFEGTIASDSFGTRIFGGASGSDLREKYLTGGPGTYTTADGLNGQNSSGNIFSQMG